ncbi:hypothetical protein CLOM_g23818 [Closterium sp. NIES-68]|nr:hypothetical protein CLOM_g23818 [Closterium sp. NIES-68]
MCVSPLNVVEQRDKCRLILDLRKINNYLDIPKFKYEGLNRVAELIRPGDWMFSIDLKSGYHHVEIHPSCWKFLGFHFKGDYYSFISLPFGLATASFVFTQLNKQLAKRWRASDVQVVPYVDDLLFLCNSHSDARSTCAAVVQDLKAAGFVINGKKSHLHPSRQIAFLGLEIDAAQGIFSIGLEPDRIWVGRYCLLRELQIQDVHDSNLSGHFGVDKNLKALQRFYYWPYMVTDVQRYVAACLICQRMKSSHQRPTGLLQPLEPPQRPFVIGLPARSSGNDAALVVVDRLTKMAHFAPCRTTITAEETARLFISTVVCLHGIPAAIISD